MTYLQKLRSRGKGSKVVADGGEKNGVWRRKGKKDGVAARMVCWRRGRMRRCSGGEGCFVGCSGGEGSFVGRLGQRFQGWCRVRAACRERESAFYWGAGRGVLGVQCGEGCEGCRGIWGARWNWEKTHTVTFFLTRGNVGNKGGFGGTGEFIGGAGRSPH